MCLGIDSTISTLYRRDDHSPRLCYRFAVTLNCTCGPKPMPANRTTGSIHCRDQNSEYECSSVGCLGGFFSHFCQFVGPIYCSLQFCWVHGTWKSTVVPKQGWLLVVGLDVCLISVSLDGKFHSKVLTILKFCYDGLMVLIWLSCSWCEALVYHDLFINLSVKFST